MQRAVFHLCGPGENVCMDRLQTSPGAIAFLVVALLVCAVVSGAALRAALG
jgi:hypothetical protein